MKTGLSELEVAELTIIANEFVQAVSHSNLSSQKFRGATKRAVIIFKNENLNIFDKLFNSAMVFFNAVVFAINNPSLSFRVLNIIRRSKPISKDELEKLDETEQIKLLADQKLAQQKLSLLMIKIFKQPELWTMFVNKKLVEYITPALNKIIDENFVSNFSSYEKWKESNANVNNLSLEEYNFEKDKFLVAQKKNIENYKKLLPKLINLLKDTLSNSLKSELLEKLISTNFDDLIKFIKLIQKSTANAKTEAELIDQKTARLEFSVYLINLFKDPSIKKILNEKDFVKLINPIVEQIIENSFQEEFPDYLTQSVKKMNEGANIYNQGIYNAEEAEFYLLQKQNIIYYKSLASNLVGFLSDNLTVDEINIFFKELISNNYDELLLAISKFKVSTIEGISLILNIINNSDQLKKLVETSPEIFGGLIKNIMKSFYLDLLKTNKIDDKIWELTDILFKDVNAAVNLIKMISEVLPRSNYVNEDGSANKKGIEESIEKIVNGINNLLTNERIGNEVKQFLSNNKYVIEKLINEILKKYPKSEKVVKDYLFKNNITFAQVIDAIVHNPNDLKKYLALLKGSGALQDSSLASKAMGTATTVVKQLWSGEGLGVNTPLVRQVIADKVSSLVPKIVKDNTPSVVKNYSPGSAEAKNSKFTNWVEARINLEPNKTVNLHDRLNNFVGHAIGKGAIDGGAQNIINYNSLSNIKFNELKLVKYQVVDFTFEKSEFVNLKVNYSTLENCNFSNISVKTFDISNATLIDCQFNGLNLGSSAYMAKAANVFKNAMGYENNKPVLEIKDSYLDDKTYLSLLSAASKNNFEIKLENVVIFENVKLSKDQIITNYGLSETELDKIYPILYEQPIYGNPLEGCATVKDESVESKVIEESISDENALYAPTNNMYKTLKEECANECVKAINEKYENTTQSNYIPVLDKLIKNGFENLKNYDLMYFAKKNLDSFTNELYDSIKDNDLSNETEIENIINSKLHEFVKSSTRQKYERISSWKDSTKKDLKTKTERNL